LGYVSGRAKHLNMARADGYPTPDTPGTITYTTRCVTIPDIPEFIALIGGLLFNATRPTFWYELGDMSPDDAAILMQDALALYDAEEVCSVDTTPVGNMMLIPHDTVPDKWLLCHGTNILDRVDYPELYDLLTEFQIDADTFELPNMSNTFVRGYSTVSEPVGYAGGQQSVVLTTQNLPPHTHDMAHTHDIGRSNAEGGSTTRIARTTASSANVAVTTGQPSNANTGSTGGIAGDASPFLIIPPYLRMKYIIKALP